MCGTQPQIITEAIYALAIHNDLDQEGEGGHKFVPTDVCVITTKKGEGLIHQLLLSPGEGKFHSLCEEYGLSGQISFSKENIRVIEKKDGSQLDDVRTVEDNNDSADFVLNVMREFTDDEDCALHVCMSGGRKTMGLYMGFALSMLGREQDRLSHVMVSDQAYGHKEFYYKPKNPVELVTTHRSGKKATINTKDIEIILADIPFFIMRTGVREKYLESEKTFSGMVNATNKRLSPPLLEIDIENRLVRASGQYVLPYRRKQVKKKPYYWPEKNFSTLLVMARRNLNGEDHIDEGNLNIDEFISTIEELKRMSPISENLIDKSDDFSLKNLTQSISEIRKAFQSALGDLAAKAYSTSHGGKGELSYGLELGQMQVVISSGNLEHPG